MPPDAHVSIGIADDHPLFRLGVRSVLSQETNMKIVGEVETGAQAMDLVQRLQPDILLLDFALPDMTGLQVLERLRGKDVATRTVLVTASVSEQDIRASMSNGAWGVLLKHTASEMLLSCIRQVSRGEYWLGREGVKALVDRYRSPPNADPRLGLTPSELAIAAMVARGASNKEIGLKLGVIEQTVKNYLRRIFRKLSLDSRLQLALYAVAHGLADNPKHPRTGTSRMPDAPVQGG